MIDTIHLVLVEQLGQMVAELQRTGRVSAERFFDDDARPTSENESYW